jgi:hypothetical protein
MKAAGQVEFLVRLAYAEGRVERINQFDMYRLGQALAGLVALARQEKDIHPRAAVYHIWSARDEMDRLLHSPVSLGTSRSSAQTLASSLAAMFNEHFNGGKFPDSKSEPIPSWEFGMLKSYIEKFETVFGEEMAEAAAYAVPRRGIFYTPALVDAADECFPQDLLPHIPEKARVEWRAAGRCFAFNLLSASGFHVARAVEGTMEAYFQLLSNQPGQILKTWNDYIIELEKIQKAGRAPIPEGKTQMKDDYRNPIMHPRVVLSEGDTKMLFNNGESLIIAMAQEIGKIQASAQPSLALVPSTGTT